MLQGFYNDLRESKINVTNTDNGRERKRKCSSKDLTDTRVVEIYFMFRRYNMTNATSSLHLEQQRSGNSSVVRAPDL